MVRASLACHTRGSAQDRRNQTFRKGPPSVGTSTVRPRSHTITRGDGGRCINTASEQALGQLRQQRPIRRRRHPLPSLRRLGSIQARQGDPEQEVMV